MLLHLEVMEVFGVFNLALCLICVVPDTRASFLIPPPRPVQFDPGSDSCFTSLNCVIDYISGFGLGPSALGGFLRRQVIFVVM